MGFNKMAKNLQALVSEKDALLPENIREGVQAFGVEGTLHDSNIFLKEFLFGNLTEIKESDLDHLSLFTYGKPCVLAYNSSLKTAVFPDRNTYISYSMGMANCGALESVRFKGLTSIGSQMFHNCTKLHTVTFDRGLEITGGSHFLGCPALVGLSIGGTVTFSRNIATVTVTLKDSTELSLESMLNLFNACEDLTGVTKPVATINLGSTNLAKLTDDQKAIVLNKNIKLT